MLETIKIKSDTELGYMVINLDDHDPNIHKHYEIEVVSDDTKNEPVKEGSEVSVKKSRSKKVTLLTALSSHTNL